MIGVLIQAFVCLLIAGLLWWAAKAILDVVPVPEPIKTVLNVLLVVILCLVVIFYGLLPLIPAAHFPLR